MELLAPAGSVQALHAAVQNGADAVYLGYGDFNARRNAKNFSAEELQTALSYCHLRGVKVYLTLNTLLTDRELPAALETAGFANALGIDAVLVQDMGLCRLLAQAYPDLPLHASTQMTIHNLPGARFCAELGLTRVVLSRELSRHDIAHITHKAPVETECFVHGALCMCYSGQCFFSALLGGRSGNRGLCAQPCRLPYTRPGDKTAGQPLSLKDLSLGAHLEQLRSMGVACLKLEGRMKRPEYVATVTGIFAAALAEHRATTTREQEILSQIFSRQGFTDGYYSGRVDGSMFGHRAESAKAPDALNTAARESYETGERVQIPLSGHVVVCADAPSYLTLWDNAGREVVVEGDAPEIARARPLDEAQLRSQLSKTGGTVFTLDKLDITLEEGLRLPVSALNALRRAGLEAMTAARCAAPTRRCVPVSALLPKGNTLATEPPRFSVELCRADQLSPALLQQKPAALWLALDALLALEDTLPALLREYPDIQFGVVFPRVATDGQLPQLQEELLRCRQLGISHALIGNWGFLSMAQEAGFLPHGDFGLGLTNSQSLAALADWGFSSATLSFELNFAQIRDLCKPLPTALLAYGRLPLMLMEHGMGTDAGALPLRDRRGETFTLIPHWGGRSELLNAKTLLLSDKRKELSALGLHELRLRFTTETAGESAAVLRDYVTDAVPRGEHTRGLYSRRVE